jgi:hypothetical protein
MRRIGLLLVICSLFGFAALQVRADDPEFAKKEKHSITGTVTSLGTDTMTLSLENKENKKGKPKEHTIKVIPQTVVFVNGKLGALTDVAVGETVKVTMDHGHASQIAITTATAAPTQP